MRTRVTLITLFSISLFAQSGLAAKYNCSVKESVYKGSNMLLDSSRVDRQCGGIQAFDTEDRSSKSGYFDCGGGISLNIFRFNSSISDGNYAQLSILQPGKAADWTTRRPLHDSVIEAKNGLPADFTLTLSIDHSNILREQNTGYYADCSKQ